MVPWSNEVAIKREATWSLLPCAPGETPKVSSETPSLLTPDRERTGETRGSGIYSAVRDTSDSDGTTALHGPYQRREVSRARDASPLAVIARGRGDLQPHEGRTQRGGAVKTVETCAVSFICSSFFM
ncbi:unnamed protein product [Ectocarpus sp. 13 AM-2016]